MSTQKKHQPGAHEIRVGVRVWLRWGGTEVPAIIVEDRGPVGHHGRHLVRVRLDFGGPLAEPIELEVPVVDVRFAA